MRVRAGLVVGLMMLSALSAADGPLATVNGKPIDVDDLGVRGQLIQLEQQRYQLLQKALDEAIAKRLIEAAAAQEGISYDAFVQREIGSKITPPSEEVVSSFYEENKLRIGRPLEDVKDAINSFLLQQAMSGRRAEVVAGLRSGAAVSILLEPPRAEVDLAQSHRRGPAEAPVQIVEFSDFQCPFCKRMQDVISEVVAKYDGQVSWFYKDLPLISIHSGAKYAAEAARCAGDQGKFWEYRDALFDADKVTDGMHEDLASKLELDLEAFAGCLSEHKYAGVVESDLAEAETLGITGTPTLLINGILLSGARSADDLSAVIERELERGE